MTKLAYDPPVSEKQRRAMWAAAEGHSTLGIPKKVGEEFVGKDAAIRAAGVIFVAPTQRALFVKRSNVSDHGGQWCFPGGQIESGETAEQAARRECNEEISYMPDGAFIEVSHELSGENVDFTTFACMCDSEFICVLDDEHTAWCWALLDDPPLPLHPEVFSMLETLGQDAQFEESKHPRDNDGKFTSGGGGGGSSAEKPAKKQGWGGSVPKMSWSNYDKSIALIKAIKADPDAYSSYEKDEAKEVHKEFLGWVKAYNEQKKAKKAAAPETKPETVAAAPETKPAATTSEAELSLMAAHYPEFLTPEELKKAAAPATPEQHAAKFEAAKKADTEKVQQQKEMLGIYESSSTKHGFALAPTAYGSKFLALKKDNSTLKIDQTGKWILETPGFQTKTGNTTEQFDALMSGDKPKWMQAGVKVATPQDIAGFTTTAPVATPTPKPAAPTPPPPAPQTPDQILHQTLGAMQAAQLLKILKEKHGGDTKVIDHAAKLAKSGLVSWDTFEHADNKVEKLNLPTTVPELAALSAYTGSAYGSLNPALRNGKISANHFPVVKTINAALDKLPKYTDTCARNASLSAADIAKYEVGSYFEERGFTSTAKGEQSHFNSGGNVKYLIKSKTGVDVSKISLHPSEQEVLFKSGTHFLVTKVEKSASGQFATIHMEEAE